MDKPFNFNEEHRDAQVFLDCIYARCLADIYEMGQLTFSVSNMTDLEVLESIVGDIVGATMWEIQTEKTLNFDRVELLKFVPQEQHLRILTILNEDSFVRNLLADEVNGQLRIDKDKLQQAMDFSGVWYDGYEMAEDAIVVDREAINPMFQNPVLLSSLLMEMKANTQGTKTLQ